MAPTSVVAVMTWRDEALCGALTVALPTRASDGGSSPACPVHEGTLPAPEAGHSSKRPPRYLARKRSAAA